jgi:glycosyltransferase involved in cell wall biosynthesis
MSPRISLALPVYDGEEFIAQAIQSIIDQDFRDFELIITDNASTDRTEDICRAFAIRDERIRFFRNESNLGAAANFNRGFELASGEYFKWCAHDDVISSNFLEECVRALDKNSDAVIAYGRLLGINQEGAMTPYIEQELPDMKCVSPARRFRTLFSMHGLDAAMFGLCRRRTLALTSLHKPYYGSDCALLAEMALFGSFIRLPNIVLYNRDHPKRSVNIHSSERLVWQNPKASGRNAFEFSSRLKHLTAIAYRHRRIAPLYQTLSYLLVWVLHPLLVGRCVLEIIGAVSPSLRALLRNAGLGALNSLQRSFKRNSARAADRQ